VLAATAGVLGYATHCRNVDYRSELAIWEDTLAKRPGNARAHLALGETLLKLGRAEPAAGHFATALQLSPRSVLAHQDLGVVLLSQGKTGPAMDHFEAALKIDGRSAWAQQGLGCVLMAQGQPAAAAAHFRAAVESEPDLAPAHQGLGDALLSQGAPGQAVAEYEAALRLDPALMDANDHLAWLLATGAAPGRADPGRAVLLAQRACAATRPPPPGCLDTLAAAYAAAGRFDAAAATAQDALDGARARGQLNLARQIEDRLKLYRAARPYRAPGPLDYPAP